MANGNGQNGNGYVKRTRYKVAKIAMSLIFALGVTGIVIGLIMQDIITIIGSSITATITGIGGVAGVYIGGDSYRPSYYPEPNNTVVIQQGGPNNNETSKEQFPPTSEDKLPPPKYVEGA